MKNMKPRKLGVKFLTKENLIKGQNRRFPKRPTFVHTKFLRSPTSQALAI